ncbi:MAG: PH domain-containing protein [Bryobacteraceae bacterium]|nr:PH domain-containing protein [Bryobacteraceae bacterium]
MADIQVRPSTTLIKVRYALAILVAAVIGYYSYTLKNRYLLAGLAVPALLIVSAAGRHVRTRFVTLEVVGDRLKLEEGMASKTSRSVPLAKVQDITVSQSAGQRLLGVGDISIVTAGDTGRLTVNDVSAPRAVAEKILDRVAAANPQRNR